MNTKRLLSYFILSLATVVLISCGTQQEQTKQPTKPEKIWSTESGMDGPESVYYHPDSERLYVSNMSGDSSKKDGEGWISILDTDGSVKEKKWVDGLNAPKGIRVHEGTLWVSDIDRILAYDLKSGEQVEEITVEDAKFLNDVVTGPDGTVYVSDMKDNTIYSVQDGELQVFAEGEQLEDPNGVLVHDERLYVGGWSAGEDKGGHLYSLNLNGEDKQLVTSNPLGNLDGLEMNGHGGYLVSDWMKGDIFRVSSAGDARKILDLDKGTADIGYIHEEHTLLIPQNQKSKIIAYKLGSDK